MATRKTKTDLGQYFFEWLILYCGQPSTLSALNRPNRQAVTTASLTRHFKQHRKRINHITGPLARLIHFWKTSTHKYGKTDYYSYIFKTSTCFISQETEILTLTTSRLAGLKTSEMSLHDTKYLTKSGERIIPSTMLSRICWRSFSWMLNGNTASPGGGSRSGQYCVTMFFR